MPSLGYRRRLILTHIPMGFRPTGRKQGATFCRIFAASEVLVTFVALWARAGLWGFHKKSFMFTETNSFLILAYWTNMMVLSRCRRSLLGLEQSIPQKPLKFHSSYSTIVFYREEHALLEVSSVNGTSAGILLRTLGRQPTSSEL